MTRGGGRGSEEIELKFDVSRAAAARRIVEGDRLGALLATGPARTVAIEDTYVDTASAAIRAARWVARFRRADGGTSITLKSSARRGAGATHRRQELEGPADARQPPASWPASAARDRLIKIIGLESLDTLVALHQRRRQRDFASERMTVEVSLDRVTTRLDGRVADRSTVLEVELLSGTEADLAELGVALAKRSFLSAATTSKLERGLEAAERLRLGRSLPKLETEPAPGVLPGDAMSAAGRKVLRFHLARLLDREPGVRAGTDADDLRKMRVAARRLRAAWRVFGDAFHGAKVRRIRVDLGVLASRLGATRDLDVQLERVANADGHDMGLLPLESAWRMEREGTRAALVHELESARHRRWLASFVRFVEAVDADVAVLSDAEPFTVSELAASRVWAAFERMRASGRRVEGASPEVLHQLRIEAKRLRYSIEFVREALPPEVSAVLARITALQDHLGALNDADVAAVKTRAFLAEHRAALAPAEAVAIEAYLSLQEAAVATLVASAGRPWRGVSSLAFRRQLGRVLAAL